MFREVLVSGAFNICLELITQVEEDTVNMSLEMYVFSPRRTDAFPRATLMILFSSIGTEVKGSHIGRL